MQLTGNFFRETYKTDARYKHRYTSLTLSDAEIADGDDAVRAAGGRPVAGNSTRGMFQNA